MNSRAAFASRPTSPATKGRARGTDILLRRPRRPSQTALAVDIIDDFESFLALRPEWDALHANDPESGIFLSWSWFETTFATNPGRWRVFVVRETGGDRAVRCILPTKYRVHWRASNTTFETEIAAAGRLNWGEYTGFVCDPDHARAALGALADTLSNLPWARLSLRYEASKDRAELFAAAFDDTRFRARWKPYLINNGTVDNLKCLRIHLPDDYETWLSSLPSANMRQKLRRHARNFVDTGRYRFTFLQPDTLDRDLDILFRFWLARWTPEKGEEKAQRIARMYRDMMLDAYRLGVLHISLVWEGERPLGVVVGVVDHAQRKLHFILSGRDETDPSPAIGLLLHAANIRAAIDQQMRVYDFGHGDEPYKYGFGTTVERVKNLEITREAGPVGKLDPYSYGHVLRRLPVLLRAGRIDAVIAACEAATAAPTP